MEEQQGAWAIVRAIGEIDLSNVAAFITDLEAAVRESPEGILIDLTEAVYMDSAGVQAILNAYVQLRRSGGLVAVITKNQIITSILKIISADKLPGFFLCDTLDNARDALREASDSE